jgi:hypothetical protein
VGHAYVRASRNCNVADEASVGERADDRRPKIHAIDKSRIHNGGSMQGREYLFDFGMGINEDLV